MPLYTYRCETCGAFDQLGGYAETTTRCACGRQARRLEVYMPAVVIAGTQAAPGTPERNEQDKRALRDRGWDYSRALETISRNRREDAQGRKYLDVAAANAEGRED